MSPGLDTQDTAAFEAVTSDNDDEDVSDEKETIYSWPSDIHRYNVLASSAKSVLLKKGPQ